MGRQGQTHHVWGHLRGFCLCLSTTNSLLRCFLFFDVCYLISGVALITMALTSEVDTGRDRLISHGLRTWRRVFLLPWLVFFLMVLGLLTVHLAHSVYFYRAQWRHVFLFLANITVFTCWRQMQRQFIMM